MGVRCLLFSLVAVVHLAVAGEAPVINFFESAQEKDLSEQRQLEARIEGDLNKFRSILESRVVIPFGGIKHEENLWGRTEPRTMSVEVILTLKKKKRLTHNEFKSVSNVINSALSQKDQIIEISIRDEDGRVWNEEDIAIAELFEITKLEQEIEDKLNARWSDHILWKSIEVSNSDKACTLKGEYKSNSKEAATADLSRPNDIRKDILGVLEDKCSSARLVLKAEKKPELVSVFSKNTLTWIERIGYFLLGISAWGLLALLYTSRSKKLPKMEKPDEDAIILTRMVERSPDEAAKWMVQALLSDTPEDAKSEVIKKEPTVPNF